MTLFRTICDFVGSENVEDNFDLSHLSLTLSLQKVSPHTLCCVNLAIFVSYYYIAQYFPGRVSNFYQTEER